MTNKDAKKFFELVKNRKIHWSLSENSKTYVVPEELDWQNNHAVIYGRYYKYGNDLFFKTHFMVAEGFNRSFPIGGKWEFVEEEDEYFAKFHW